MLVFPLSPSIPTMPSSFHSPSRGLQEHNARLAVISGSLLYWALGWAVALMLDERNLHWLMAMLAGPIALGAWLWGSLRTWRGAAWGLAIAQLLVVVVLAWQPDAEDSTLLLNLVVMVAFFGWILGARAASVMALVAVLTAAVLAWLGHFSWRQCLGLGYTLVFFLGAIHLGQRRFEQQLAKQQTALDALQEHKRQVAALFQAVEQSPSSVVMVDLEGAVRYVNAAFERQSGYKREEVLGKHSVHVSANGLSVQERDAMRKTLDAGVVWHSVLENRRKDGSPVTESVSISPIYEDGKLSGFVEIKQDVTDRLQAEQRIAYLQNFDGLTQLPNRYALIKQLQKLLQDAEIERSELGAAQSIWHAILKVDLDRFKKFNDARGSAWSDALLQALALRIRTLVPESAFVARTTADQFAVVLEQVGSNRHQARLHAYTLAKNLRDALQAVEVQYEGSEQVQISCGIGFTVFPFVEPGLDGDDPVHIMRRCSVALNQAKNKGAGKIHAYSEALAETAQRRLKVEQGLQEALECGHLRLFVQPQVNMFGQVTGLEALVRWQHPQDGLVSPGEFIPIAEESGLIIPLGDWVLEQVCSLLSRPEVKAGGYSISANVSALQLQAPDFVTKLAQRLQQTGIDPQRLVLEVTESLLMTEVDAIVQKMVTLRGLGVQFAIDDFGTGYSSLAYLMRLPIQEIKMDQSFIRDLQPDGPSGAMVQALLMVAKSQQLRVVAEGVEEAEQAQLLQAWEPSLLCQGYFFSKPLPVEQWLQNPGKLSDAAATLP